MNYNDEELIALLKRLHDKLHQADEIEKGSIIVILPPSLSTDEAMVLWKKAQEAGIVDEHYQPLLSRTLSAVFANEMARRLEIKNKWSIFEKLWHRKNMRSDYNTAQTQRQSLEFRDKLKKILG